MLSVAIFRADYLRKARMPPTRCGLAQAGQRLCSNAIRGCRGGGVLKNFNLTTKPRAFSKKVKKIGDFPPLFLHRKIGIAVAQ
jgi:hypothetical protein